MDGQTDGRSAVACGDDAMSPQHDHQQRRQQQQQRCCISGGPYRTTVSAPAALQRGCVGRQLANRNEICVCGSDRQLRVAVLVINTQAN